MTFDVISATEKNILTTKIFICNTTLDIQGSPAYYVPTHSTQKIILIFTVCFFATKNIYYSTKGLDEDFFMYYEDVEWF